MAKFMKETHGELGQAVRNFSAAMGDLHATLSGRDAQVGAMLELRPRAPLLGRTARSSRSRRPRRGRTPSSPESTEGRGRWAS